MFKRLLGIQKLEKNFKVVGDSLNRSWKWINHFNQTNSHIEDRIVKLEQSNLQLIEVTRELMGQLQKQQEQVDIQAQSVVEEQVIVEAPQNVIISRNDDAVNLPDKDLFLVKLVYQYAAFDKEHSVDTNTIYSNLPYKITPRGLRKKMNSLVDNGLLRTSKVGNTRYWYLNDGALGKVKKSLQAKE